MKIESLKITYSQRQDDCSDDPNDPQQITIETADAGAGPYIVISTKRWAFSPDDPEEWNAFVGAIKSALAQVAA